MDTPQKKPKHVAIIMDGNARWASAHGVSVREGHEAGSVAVHKCIDAAIKEGVPYLTLFAFSSENWGRAPEEVSDLQSLLSRYLDENLEELHANKISLRILGSLERFPQELVDALEAAEQLTKDNTALTLSLALSYGSRDEIAHACAKAMADAKAGKIAPEDMNEDLFASYLQTKGIPDPDIIVRTSGEQRLSNFLMWQAAYAEIFIMKILWPDFTQDHFNQVIKEFACRKRRFGERPNK